MEICYDGALVMPKNYAVVNEEEMTYVNGGWNIELRRYYEAYSYEARLVELEVILTAKVSDCIWITGGTIALGLAIACIPAVGVPIESCYLGVASAVVALATTIIATNDKTGKEFTVSKRIKV